MGNTVCLKKTFIIKKKKLNAYPINGSAFGPTKSPSSTKNRINANSGLKILKTKVLLQIGFNPFDAK